MDPGIQLATTETDSVGFASYKVPMHADFLISHSTISGFYSWRNTSAGSWFIQSLVSLVEKEVKDRDVVSLLTNINKKSKPRIRITVQSAGIQPQEADSILLFNINHEIVLGWGKMNCFLGNDA